MSVCFVKFRLFIQSLYYKYEYEVGSKEGFFFKKISMSAATALPTAVERPTASQLAAATPSSILLPASCAGLCLGFRVLVSSCASCGVPRFLPVSDSDTMKPFERKRRLQQHQTQ